MKLTVFAHSSDLGGAERSLLELVKELKEDHQVCCMVLLPWPGPLESQLEQLAIEHHVVPYCWWCASTQEDADRLGPALASAAWAVDNQGLALVRQFDPDVVMTMTMVIPWGALVAAELGKPHLWQVCEFGDIDHGLHFVLPLEEILAFIRACSDFILTLSEYHRTYLFPDLEDDRCLPLYRHIEIPEAGVEEPAEFFSGGGAFRLGMFATILPSKGQADAVLAIADLVSRGWDVELLLAGYQADDAYLERLRGLVSENGLQERVRFPGVISEVYSAMRQADVVVVCSRQEAFGRVALEAMLLGRPVVYAEAAALSEIMIDGVTGLSYPPGVVSESSRTGSNS